MIDLVQNIVQFPIGIDLKKLHKLLRLFYLAALTMSAVGLYII